METKIQSQAKTIRSELESIRVKLSDSFLITAAILAPIALAISVARAATFAWDFTVASNAILALVLCGMAWKRKWVSTRSKSIVIVAILLGAGVSGAFQYGLLSTTLFYLVLAPYFAALLLGRRGAIITLGLTTLAIICVGGNVVSHDRLPPWDVARYMTSPIAWTLEVAILLLSNALVLVTVNDFASALVKSLATKYRNERHLLSRSRLLEQSTKDLRQAHDLAQASLRKNAAMVERLDKVIRQTVDAFATATVHTDPYTAGHERRVADLALVLGKRLGLSDDRLVGLELAARSHDIGQLKIPSEILLRPHSLTALEFKFIQLHVEAGWEILKTIDFPWPVADIVLQHHENFDGTGYPRGTSGDGILLEARIIRAADMVEAMSSHRPFRAAYTRQEVLHKLSAASGKSLDPVVAEICLQVLSDGYSFPTANTPGTQQAANIQPASSI